MKSTRICLVSLGCVAGAVAFGVVANATIDLVMPADAKPAAIVKASEAPPSFALASTTSTPVELGPLKVKTLAMTERDGLFVEQDQIQSQISDAAAPQIAVVPLPRPRPAAAPSLDNTASISGRPGSLAIAAATRKMTPEDGELLSPAGIDRLKTALALTAEQEEFWPAIASELRTIGKVLSHKGGAKVHNARLDTDTMQRLYWAAAPLISRLSYEQKLKAKQMARLMGLAEVAEAL